MCVGTAVLPEQGGCVLLLVSVYPLTKHHIDCKASIVIQKVQSASWSLVLG